MKGWSAPRSSVWTWYRVSPTCTLELCPRFIRPPLRSSSTRGDIQNHLCGMPYLTEDSQAVIIPCAEMSGSFLDSYTPLLIHLLVAMGLAGALVIVSSLVGWRRPNRAKQEAYECGMEPTGDARQPSSVKFYLVAMVFILFDVEAIFLYPWAYIFRDMFKISHSFGVYGFVEMLVYIAILLVGYIYLWKKGAFDWHKA